GTRPEVAGFVASIGRLSFARGIAGEALCDGARAADGVRRGGSWGTDRVPAREPDVVVSLAERDPPRCRAWPLHRAGSHRDGGFGQARRRARGVSLRRAPA